MPRAARIAVAGGVGVLLVAGGIAWAVNGTAILLDIAVGAARLLCL